MVPTLTPVSGGIGLSGLDYWRSLFGQGRIPEVNEAELFITLNLTDIEFHEGGSLLNSYGYLFAAMDEGKAIALLKSGVALAKSRKWTGEKLHFFWLVCAQIASCGVVRLYEWGHMTDTFIDASKVTAIALGMTEAELEEAIEKGTIQAEMFLPAFARQLQAEFEDGAEEGDRH